MSSSNAKYYSMLIKSLKQYGISLDEHKKNPSLYFMKDAKFRQYVYDKFDYNKEFTWYQKPLIWKDLLQNNNLDNFMIENSNWYSSTSEQNPDKRRKIDTEGEDLEELPEIPSPSTETSTKQTKRPIEDSIEVPPKKNKSLREETQTQNTVSTQNTVDKIPGGTSEVQQQVQQGSKQLQTPRGTLQNQRGTLQGEAGNIKVQKPLERYGIVKVTKFKNMSYDNKVNNIIIFASEDSKLMNLLMSLMDETYPSGNIYSTKYTDEECNINYLLVGWHLNFNIGYTKLYEKLGLKFSKIICYKKSFNHKSYSSDEEVHSFLIGSFAVRNECKTQLSTLAEAVHAEQELKAQVASNNDSNRYNRKRKLPLFD